MNDSLINETVGIIEGAESPVYVMKDKSQFSITEYKVMGNVVSLMKCVKATLNGDIQLVYLKDKARPARAVIGLFNDEQLARVIRSFLDALVEINSNGFLKSSNIDVSLDRIFVNTDDLTVRLIYLPVNTWSSDGKMSGHEVNSLILSIIEKAGDPESSILSAIKSFCCSNTETSIESSRNLFIQLMQQYKIEENKEDAGEELILSFSDGNEQRSFHIDEGPFTIGFKEGSADGIIKSNKYISSPHCEITRENGRWMITDLDSTNGTFVNGKRLGRQQKEEIRNEDAVRLANSTLYVEVRRG